MTTMALGLALLLAAPQGTGSPAGFADDVEVGAPVSKGNLSVFPLALKKGATGAEPLTLDEAVKAKQLAIDEAKDGGTVNALEVRNRADRPVLLMAGELLLGGKQDRIVARSLVLAPRSKQQVAVFCVEHGRWQGERSFQSGGAMGHVELRKTALAGDQGKVWAEVARSNKRLETENASDTYRAAARKLAGDAGPIAKELSAALAARKDAAGLAVAIDGEVVAVEWFASPRLFGQVREKLVASYVAQALADRGGKPAQAAAAPPPAKAVADFAAKAEQGEAVVERTRDRGAAVKTTYLK